MISNILLLVLVILFWIVFYAFENWLKHSSLSDHNALTYYKTESTFQEFKMAFNDVNWKISNRNDLHLHRNDCYILTNLFIIEGTAYKLNLVDFIKAKKYIVDYVEDSD